MTTKSDEAQELAVASTAVKEAIDSLLAAQATITASALVLTKTGWCNSGSGMLRAGVKVAEALEAATASTSAALYREGTEMAELMKNALGHVDKR